MTEVFSYQWADGYDNAGGLATLAIQPAMPEGIIYPELVYDGDGHASFNGEPYARLVWSGGIDDEDRNTILSAFGLSDSLASPIASNEGTARIRDNNGSSIVVNAIANLPSSTRRSMDFFENFVITLTGIEAV